MIGPRGGIPKAARTVFGGNHSRALARTSTDTVARAAFRAVNPSFAEPAAGEANKASAAAVAGPGGTAGIAAEQSGRS